MWACVFTLTPNVLFGFKYVTNGLNNVYRKGKECLKGLVRIGTLGRELWLYLCQVYFCTYSVILPHFNGAARPAAAAVLRLSVVFVYMRYMNIVKA